MTIYLGIYLNIAYRRAVVFNLWYAKTSYLLRKIEKMYILFCDKQWIMDVDYRLCIT
jgi:hypothetical protein